MLVDIFLSSIIHLESIKGNSILEEEINAYVLKENMVHPDVSVLRRKLHLFKDLPTNNNSDVFDTELTAAVKSYQRRFNIPDDGIVGNNTKLILSYPIEYRLDKLRQAQKVWNAIPDRTAVVVNIAGQKVYAIKDGIIDFDLKVIVGSRDTPTPSFSSEIRQIVWNPYWNVPRSIVPELIEQFKRNFNDIEQRGYEVTVAGRWADYNDLFNFSPNEFRIVQNPGPYNALGGVKIQFPNKYSVYLHDTPNKNLFSKRVRTFSHGCIRVENIDKLVEWIHGEGLPIHIRYMLAGKSDNNLPEYYNDIYSKY